MTKLKDGFWKDKGILSDDYVLLAGGGHMALSSLSGSHNHDSRYLRKDTNDSTQYQYTFSKTNDHAIQIGTIRGLAFGSQTGNYLHIYERVHIGSPNGWGSRNAPTYGLSTYGGAWLATDTGSVGIGTTSPATKLHLNGGLLRIVNNGVTGTIGAANGSWFHIEASANFYFNRDIHVNGALWRYNTNYGIASDGQIYGKAIYANRDASSTYGGISLYSNDANTYAIFFRGTSTYGTHGGVTGDLATYFTMNDATNRGWIFRRGSTNIASIDGNGRIYVGAVTSSANPGIYWNPYVESTTDASDAAGIWQIKSGVAGGSELRISQQNDSTDVINICAPYYIYFNSKRAFAIYDGWLRINENSAFNSGIYTGSSLIRTDNQLQVGGGGSAFYANSSGNGWISNQFIIGASRTRFVNFASTLNHIPPYSITGLLSFGYPVYTDPEFASGNNSVGVYNNSSGGTVTITREASTEPANSSGYQLKIVTNGTASPGAGGFVQSISSRANAVFVQIFRAKIPTGWQVNTASNSMGTSYSDGWLTDQAGTGKWEWYARIVHCGSTGTFSSGGHVYLSNTTGGANTSVTWYLCHCSLIDITKQNYNGLRTRYSDNANSLTNPGKYYWANIPMQTSSDSTKQPTFGRTNITYAATNGTSALQLNIGSTSYAYGLDIQSSQTEGSTTVSILAGRNHATNNQLSGLFYYAGNGSANNRFGFGFYGNDNILNIRADKRVGINTTAPAYTLDVTGTIRATSRIYANEWIEFSQAYTGLYWPNGNNASHFHPNDTTTYGQFVLRGSRGGYSGITLARDANYMTIMDNSQDKGLYQQTGGVWIIYYRRDANRIGIRTSSNFGADININGTTHIRYSTLDNTAFKNILTIFGNNSNESSGNTFTEANSSWGIGFQRQWQTGTMTGICAGIYAVPTASWRSGLAFRVKNNTTASGGTHDVTAVYISPAGSLLQQNNNSWLTPARTQIGRLDASTYTDRSIIGTTNGNLHIDPYYNANAGTYSTYINYYSNAGYTYFNGGTYRITNGGQTYFAGYHHTGHNNNDAVLLAGGSWTLLSSLSNSHTHPYLPLAGGWMNWNAQISFKGYNESTSVYSRIGYNTSASGQTMHCVNTAGHQANGAFYITSNGSTSANDTGGLAIDNEGVTVFGAGDAGSNFTGVFRVLNEDNVPDGPQFLVTKNTGAAIKYNLSVGQNTVNTSYNFYVNGTSYLNGQVYMLMGGRSFSWYSPQQYNASDANPSYYSALCAIININSYSGWFPWIRAVDSEKGTWVIGQYTNQLHIGRIDKANTSNTLTKRWDYSKDGTLLSPNGFRHGEHNNNDAVLLAGGGWTLLSSLSGSHTHPYLPLAGGTMNSNAQIVVGTINNSSGQVYSGGIQLREYQYKTTSVTDNYENAPGITFHWGGRWVHKLNMHTNDLYWDNYKIWHAGNDGSGSGLDADTVDNLHANQLVPRQYNTRFYPFVKADDSRSIWHKVTLPWAGYTSGSNAWMMTSMELVLGGAYLNNNMGRIYLQYYFSKNASNVWAVGQVQGVTIGNRISDNGITIKYDIANPGIFYVKVSNNIYNSFAIENISANDTAPSFDFRNTTITSIAEGDVPASATGVVPLYHTITTQNGYWANLPIQLAGSNTTVPSFGAIRMNGATSAGTNYITGSAGRIFFGGNFHIDSLGSNKTYINHYTANDVYMVTGGGKVGIGTASPSQKLHVAGNTRITGSLDICSEARLKIWNVTSTRNSSYGAEMVFLQTSIDGADPSSSWPDKNRNDLFIQPKGGHVTIGERTTHHSYSLLVKGTTYFDGDVTHNGIIYLANGTTYWINNSAIGYLNDLRVDQTRLVDNWLGFYQSNNAGGNRYGYIQANADRMYFRKENGVNSYAFDFGGGHIYTNGNYIFAGYLNTAISDENPTIGSIYIRNTSDNYIRRISVANFGSQLGYRRNLGASNYITITVNGDAATYYPVVIGSPSDYYPYQFVNISRTYNETAPDSWNTSTHKGGLSMAIFWNGSRYWDGNASGGEAFVVRLYQSYCTMVGGVDNSTAGKVVWLRGGGANYHIHSMQGIHLSATVYTSTYTDSASRSFAPRSASQIITPTVQWPGDVQNGAAYLRDRSNSTATYTNYGAAGLGWGSITWLTCWNGYELRAISKAEMASVVNVYQHTSNNVDYPLVWSNQNNTSTVQANQLHKSYADLVYNPANKEIKTWSFAPQGENTNRGIHFPGGAWINSIGTSIIFRNATIRFGGSGWDWNAWAGLNFDGNTTINIGMPNNSHWTANSNKTAGTIRTVSSKIEIFPDGNSNFGEGLRIHSATNGWTSLVLCGTDLTAFNGTSANSWSLHTNGGNFYLNKNNSSGAVATRLWGHANGYTVGSTSRASANLTVTSWIEVTGGASATMSYATTNPRITFSENGSQAVGIVYTDYDSYRASKGLKVMDVDNTDTGNVWLEVQRCIYGNGIFASLNGSSTDNGLSLYGSDYTYALMFRGTGNRGKWGDVQSDWATYSTMSNTAQRGWVWQSGTAEANMSAALSVRGVFATRAVGNNAGYLAFPQNNSYYTSTATVTGALKIILPRYQTNCMLMFDVNIFTYDEGTSNIVTYRIGGYEYGSTGWYAPVSKVFSYGRGDKVNLSVRFGYDGSKTCVTIGETNTTWKYPQVSITNVTYGYSDVAISSWGYGWGISFTTTLLSSVSTTFTDPYFNGMYWANQRVRPTSSTTTTPQFGKVMINTTSTTYTLNIGGDSHATGWHRAGSGFYCEGNGVHYTHAGTYGEIYTSSNNIFNFTTGSWTTLYFNYGSNKFGNTYVNNFIWNAGSSTSYANHTMGHLTACATTSDTSPGNAAIEVRELNRTTTTPSHDYANAPRIGFHWGGRYWANIALYDSAFRFMNNSCSDYVNTWHGAVYSSFIYANRTGSNSSGGVSLYSTDANTYGIYFRGTASGSSWGKLQGVQSDWATYLTMSNTVDRGWIFRRGSTNVLAIDGYGTLNRFYTYRLRLPGAAAKPVGWYQMCRVSDLDGYFNFNLFMTGGWSTGAPTMALLNLCCYHTTPILTQITGRSNGVITKVRLRNISGGDYYLDVYQATTYTSSTSMADEYFLINGSVKVTEIAEPTAVTTATGGTELTIRNIGTLIDTNNISPSIGINGNQIRITVGGVNSSYITVPYATKSDSTNWLDPQSNFRTSRGLGYAQTSDGPLNGSNTTGTPTSWAHYIMMSHENGQTYYHYQLAFPFWGPPMYQRKTGGSTTAENQSVWYTFLTSENYTTYVNNYYWANVKVSTSSSTTTTPQFGYVGIGTAPDSSYARLSFVENENAICFRKNTSYKTCIQYKTVGNEALVFATQQSVTSFIFKCGYAMSNGSDWQSGVIGTPSVQIKNQSLYVNTAIANGSTPGYNFYVTGQSYMTHAGDILKLASTNTYSCINYSQSSGAGWSVGSNSSNQFYFYNTSKGASYTYIDINGSIYTHGWVHLNRVNSGTDNGLTFYGSDSNYSIMFRQTSNLGTHESVNGDWAMYFNMNNSGTRGWIFRRWGTKNVASLSGYGRFWVGTDGDTETERQIGVASGAGKLYMYSSAATTSGRGMYTPAHGTGTARSVFSLDTNNRVYFADSYNGTQTALAYSQAGMAYNAITWMTCWNGYELRAINAAAVRQFLFGAAAIGNNIRPVYWNGSTLANTDFYRIQYDGSEDWASYKYHRVAYVNSPGAYADIWIRLAITSGDTASRVGELYLRYRTGSGRLYESAEISWITKTTGINLNHFKLLYFNNNPSSGVSKCEFWVEIPGRWGGYGFKVIDSGSSRANNGILGWTFDADNTGHGSASLPSATGTVTSYLAPLTGYWANLGIQTAPSNTTSPTFSTCYTSNWFRSTGATGWYSESYGGGWYMTDPNWIRNYGSKSIYLNVGSASGLAMGTNGRVAINGTSASYPLHVYGDSYATGWSRAGSGFYCEGNGVHYTHAGTYGEIYTSSNNVFNFTTGSWTTLYFNYGSNKFGNTYVTNFIWNAGSSTTYAGHTLGNLYVKGVIYLTSHEGSWVSGMSTNPSIWYRNGNAIDASSYWAMYAMKSSSSHVINFGGLGNNIGFLGYYAGRTANNYDWYFWCNTANGQWTASARLNAPGFYHTSYGSPYWVNRTDGSAAKFDYSSKNSSKPTYVWGWAADNDYRLYNVAYIDTHYTANLYVGSASTASNSQVTNPYLKLYENSTLRNQYQIKGSGTTTVSSDSSGNITISSSGGGISGISLSTSTSSANKYLWGSTATSGTVSSANVNTSIYFNNSGYLYSSRSYAGGFYHTSYNSDSYAICAGGGVKKVGKEGQPWTSFIAWVGVDGVMEIGKYIDWHCKNGTRDYDCRFVIDHSNGNTIYLPTGYGSSTLYLALTTNSDGSVSSGGSSISKDTSCSSTRYIIGTDSTSGTFTKAYCNSCFWFTTNGAYHTSDIRKKYDIRDILNDDVNRLFETENGFIRHFKWINTNEDAYGFIAQELQEYCPEAVSLNNDDGYYSVNYNVAFSKIIGAMFKKIKEQEQIINKLQRKMEVS